MILKALAMPRRSIFRFLSFDSTHEIANLIMTRIEYWDSQSLSRLAGTNQKRVFRSQQDKKIQPNCLLSHTLQNRMIYVYAS